MKKTKKQLRMMEITGGVLLILYALCQWVLFPYIAVIKAENGKFKEAAAYVVDKKNTKWSFQYIIKIDNDYYDEYNILPSKGMSTLKGKQWDNFPIRNKIRYFLNIDPNTCKKVQYAEVYNIFGFKNF